MGAQSEGTTALQRRVQRRLVCVRPLELTAIYKGHGPLQIARPASALASRSAERVGESGGGNNALLFTPKSAISHS